MHPDLTGQTILITGSARRLGRAFALAAAGAGAQVIIHHGHSQAEAEAVQAEIASTGGTAHILEADLGDPQQVSRLFEAAQAIRPLTTLINSAAIFEPLSLAQTTLVAWQRHLSINLTTPFLLSQAFGAAHQPSTGLGRIVNILDWRALRPGADHFPYTISKAALAALTHSLAVALAPNITVNGLALGAILPPSDGKAAPNLLETVPAGRWAQVDEVCAALLFLLSAPGYLTGEIIHLDGGRHLV